MLIDSNYAALARGLLIREMSSMKTLLNIISIILHCMGFHEIYWDFFGTGLNYADWKIIAPSPLRLLYTICNRIKFYNYCYCFA